MAAYRRVYDSHHLQADCQEPGSAPEPIHSAIEYGLPLPFYLVAMPTMQSETFSSPPVIIISNMSATSYIEQGLGNTRTANRQTRFQLNTYGCRAFSVAGPMARNSLPDFIRDPTGDSQIGPEKHF